MTFFCQDSGGVQKHSFKSAGYMFLFFSLIGTTNLQEVHIKRKAPSDLCSLLAEKIHSGRCGAFDKDNPTPSSSGGFLGMSIFGGWGPSGQNQYVHDG